MGTKMSAHTLRSAHPVFWALYKTPQGTEACVYRLGFQRWLILISTSAWAPGDLTKFSRGCVDFLQGHWRFGGLSGMRMFSLWGKIHCWKQCRGANIHERPLRTNIRLGWKPMPGACAGCLRSCTLDVGGLRPHPVREGRHCRKEVAAVPGTEHRKARAKTKQNKNVESCL